MRIKLNFFNLFNSSILNYIKRIEDNLADRKIDRLKKSYKKTKKLNIFLAMTTIISILLAIFI